MVDRLSPAVGNALLVISGHVRHANPRDAIELALVRMPPDEEELGLEIAPGEIVGLRVVLSLELADLLLTEEPPDVEEAIRLLRRALPLRDTAPRTWARAQHNIGVAEMRRFGADRPGALVRAVAAFQSALEVVSPTTAPNEWTNATVVLAEVFLDVLPGDRAANVAHAIALLREARQRASRDVDAIARIRLTATLGAALVQRGALNDVADLDEAIQLCGEADRLAEGIDEPRQQRVDRRMNLGVYLSRRAELTGEGWGEAKSVLEDVSASIDPSSEPQRWARAAGNFAIALKQAFDTTAADVRRAVLLLRKASELQVAAGDLWLAASNQNNLGNALLQLPSGDRMENVGQAIEAYAAALRIWTREAHPHEWALTTARLADAYLARAILGAPEYGNAALREFAAALSAINPAEHPASWAGVANRYGSAYLDVADESSLRRAVELFEQASDVLTRARAPHTWASYRHNLGNARYRLAWLEDDRDGLVAAADAYREALDARPREAQPYLWAQTVTMLARQLAETGQLEAAADRCRAALEVFRSGGWTSDIRSTAWRLAHLEASRGMWSQAAEAAQEALAAAEGRYAESLLRQGRESELANTAGLATFAAYALLRGSGDAAAAADIVERGRARLLTDALATHTARDVAAAQEVQAAEAAAIELARTPVDPASADESYRRRAEQVLRERIRLAQSKLPPPLAASTTARVDRPVVYLLETDFGGLALVQMPDGRVLDIRADDLPDISTAARRVLELQASWGPRHRRELAELLDAVLPVLGRYLCGPVAEVLRTNGAQMVVMVPCGLIGALPIHAAPYGSGCLADEFTVSYAPSRGVLASAAYRLADRRAPTSLLAVTNPTGNLPCASVELDGALNSLGPTAIELAGVQATVASVVAAMRHATHIHFACHGRSVAERPLDSHVRLAGEGRLSLADLLTTHRDELAEARLVVASACQTAVFDASTAPDEVVGLPAGFLQAGVPGFVGTLWPVGDFASALVMIKFYELLLPPHNRPPDAALMRAATWLRDLDGAAITSILDEHPRLAEHAGAVIEYARRRPRQRFFSRPSSWAAHVFVGAAGDGDT